MAKVTGIGGVFLKCRGDSAALAARTERGPRLSEGQREELAAICGIETHGAV